MITITTPTTTKTFPDESLAEICLMLCGGGNTESQTREAMLLSQKIQEKGEAQRGHLVMRMT